MLPVSLQCMAQGLDTGTKAEIAYHRGQARNSALPFRDRAAGYEAIIRLTDKTNPDYQAYLELSDLYEQKADYRSRADVLSRLGKIIKKDSIGSYCRWLYSTATNRYYANKPDEAIRDAILLSEISKPDSLRGYNIDSYIFLSGVFSSAGLYATADRYMDKANAELKILKKSDGVSRSMIKALSSRLNYAQSVTYASRGEIDKAFEILNTAIKAESDSVRRKSMTGTMASIYLILKQPASADTYFRIAVDTRDMSHTAAINVLNYFNFLMANGRSADARALIDSKDTLLRSMEGGQLNADITYCRYRLAKAEGNLSSALAFLENAFSQTDSVSTHNKRAFFNNVIIEEESRLKDIENEHISSQTQKLIVAFAVLLTLSGAVLALAFRNRRRMQSEQQHNTRLLGKIREMHREHKEETRETEVNLEKRNQELSALSIRLARMTEILNEVKDLSSKTADNPENHLARIRNIMNDFSMPSNVWEMFRVYFEQVNHEFFDNLYKIAPDLTNAEVRMCAFKLANLTTKEIALLTNRSARTVETITYNLRKKLNITGSTEAYMRRLSMVSSDELDKPTEDKAGGNP